MNATILDVKNLTKQFNNLKAVDGVSFSVSEGEIFGLLGPNGAGKSTTISMLTGVLAPDKGEIRLNNESIYADLNRAKHLIGYVPQDLALYPTLSAVDNLNFFGQIYGYRGNELRDRVNEALRIVQLTDRAGDRVKLFSGGMKRRVNLAIGLLHTPRVLFLDEPTVGVDPQSRNAIFESLKSLNRQGTTIIYTTHYMEEAERLCGRVAIMDAGKVIAMDTPQNLINHLGEGLIRLEIQDERDDTLRDSISRLGSVREVTRRGRELEIRSRSFEETIVDAMQIIASFNTRVCAMNLLEANLETVFLNLTGRSIRE